RGRRGGARPAGDRQGAPRGREAVETVSAMSVLSSAASRMLRLPPPTTPSVDVERGVRLPAEDGVELLTDLYLPRPLQPRPSILIRTPYGRAGIWGLFARGFAERGCQVVIQSWRGT